MAKIQLTDTPQSAIVKMVEGNPGAISVCMKMLAEAPDIDPQAAFGGLGSILFMDTLEIYGPRIWMLYKDVCGEDMVKTLGMLRAVQLGITARETLMHAIDNCGEGLDVDAALVAVKERLVDFGGK